MTRNQLKLIIENLIVEILKAEEYERFKILTNVSEMIKEDFVAKIEDSIRDYLKEYESDDLYVSFNNFRGNIKVHVTMIDNLESILFTIVTHEIFEARTVKDEIIFLSDIKSYNRLKKVNPFLGESKEDFIRNCIVLVMITSMSKNKPDWSRTSYYKTHSGKIKKSYNHDGEKLYSNSEDGNI